MLTSNVENLIHYCMRGELLKSWLTLWCSWFLSLGEHGRGVFPPAVDISAPYGSYSHPTAWRKQRVCPLFPQTAGRNTSGVTRTNTKFFKLGQPSVKSRSTKKKLPFWHFTLFSRSRTLSVSLWAELWRTAAKTFWWRSPRSSSMSSPSLG